MILNYTPHTIDVYRRQDVIPDTGRGFVARHGRGPVYVLPSAGVARAASSESPAGTVDGIPLVEVQYGRLEGLPRPSLGVYLVVSAITAQAARAQGRSTDDLLLTTGLVRDADGRIVGCTAFARA